MYAGKGHRSTPLVHLGCSWDNPVISLALSRDGKLLATGSRSGLVTPWDLSQPMENSKDPIMLGSQIQAKRQAVVVAV